MTENRTIHLVDVPIGGKGGFVWNRLHSEREGICKALLKRSDSTSQAQQRQELLQARLRTIDDALDRLMSGSYGICSECGGSIEEATLEVDPAWALCRNCSGRGSQSKIILENLNPFDTILIHTHNSDYRILLLDPKTGRALVEGGSYLLEPSESLIKGSAAPGAAFNMGAICVGCRLEMWFDERAFLTSPIKSIEVKHNAAVESLQNLSEVVH